MMIRHKGQIKILDGRAQFDSIFWSKSKQKRRKAFRKLFDGLKERGWLVGGKKMPKIAEPPHPSKLMNMKDPSSGYKQLNESLKAFITYLDTELDTSFYQHETTGQIIQYTDLMAATKLFSLPEILEMLNENTR